MFTLRPEIAESRHKVNCESSHRLTIAKKRDIVRVRERNREQLASGGGGGGSGQGRGLPMAEATTAFDDTRKRELSAISEQVEFWSSHVRKLPNKLTN